MNDASRIRRRIAFRERLLLWMWVAIGTAWVVVILAWLYVGYQWSQVPTTMR